MTIIGPEAPTQKKNSGPVPMLLRAKPLGAVMPDLLISVTSGVGRWSFGHEKDTGIRVDGCRPSSRTRFSAAPKRIRDVCIRRVNASALEVINARRVAG